MLKPQGYAVIVDPDQPLVERDSITCFHCQQIVFVKPGTASTVYLVPSAVPFGSYREEPGAFCRVCMRPICLVCCDRGTCTPWEIQLEKSEARDRFLRSAGLL